uniref:Uncharacterized 3.4 kDa protein in atpE-petA intergenic region n=1 Tax=Cyanophora paradoxa TaxID=2762 RepID=YCX7_CYAPA|nr:hypothetical protein CypaCp106 [Cyanophora paradoxa]P48328.1 RecName: Full=Uncharacterized 3.4 kDa protein in atpE-petA intergenic region; AltName: Full=ORF27 [Cyanophora paradoxa]AAA81274.1 orf27 [Cyanophora paradoxa]
MLIYYLQSEKVLFFLYIFLLNFKLRIL